MTKRELAEILGLTMDQAHQFDGTRKRITFYIYDAKFYVNARNSDSAWDMASDIVISQLGMIIGDKLKWLRY